MGIDIVPALEMYNVRIVKKRLSEERLSIGSCNLMQNFICGDA